MRIVLDAMGGDHAPQVTIDGAVQAARELGVEVILVGRQEAIEAELAKYDTKGLNLPIVHASQVVGMEEHTMAVKEKSDSSMVVGMRLVKDGKADAFVSAGNSGAVMAAALFNLGRIKGVKRPALSAVYPTTSGRCVFLDVGANTDCKPEYLLQFAIMGHVYAERVLGIPNPKVGLLSNGEEEDKGTMVVREAYQLLKESRGLKPRLNFIGNVEGKDLPAGMADVVVSDGFAGNVAVKLSEGLVMSLFRTAKRELTTGSLAKLALLLMLPGVILSLPGAILLVPAFKRLAKRFDYAEVGGAPLLGVDGVVIIAHGRSNAKAIKNAIGVARQAVEGRMVAIIKEGVSG